MSPISCLKCRYSVVAKSFIVLVPDGRVVFKEEDQTQDEDEATQSWAEYQRRQVGPSWARRFWEIAETLDRLFEHFVAVAEGEDDQRRQVEGQRNL